MSRQVLQTETEKQSNSSTISFAPGAKPQTAASLVGGALLEASCQGRSLDWRLGRLETEWLVSQSDCGTVGGKIVS